MPTIGVAGSEPAISCELAKCYHPGGIDIDTLDSKVAVALTREHLKAKSVTLFEPAIQFGNLQIRINLLV